MVTDRVNLTDACGIFCSVAKSSQHSGLLHSASPRVEFRKSKNGNKKSKNGNFIGSKLRFCRDAIWAICVKPNKYTASLEHTVSCLPTRTHGSEAKECIRDPDDCSDISRAQIRDGEGGKLFDSLFMDQSGMPESTFACSSKGLAEACKYVYNDAKFVNERARNDIVLLSRGITRLNKRARQDVAILGLEFLKLDARAREDTEKIDHGMKKKAARLHHMAKILKEEAQSKLKKVADRHWSDGALDADLRRVDFCARRRAMEDAFMALEFVRNIHNMMVSTMSPLPRKEDSQSVNNMMKLITLKKNGKSLDFFPREVSTDQITAIQDAYLCMASALTEADGIDYTDPDELELLVATLIDLDAMDGKSSVSLLAECSSSPDVSTRQALANALAAAPSMWTLGNAGMGALQRLADDSNPAVASAASKAIEELKKQWKIEEGDCWMFTMNHKLTEDGGADADVEQDNPQ